METEDFLFTGPMTPSHNVNYKVQCQVCNLPDLFRFCKMCGHDKSLHVVLGVPMYSPKLIYDVKYYAPKKNSKTFVPLPIPNGISPSILFQVEQKELLDSTDWDDVNPLKENEFKPVQKMIKNKHHTQMNKLNNFQFKNKNQSSPLEETIKLERIAKKIKKMLEIDGSSKL